MTNNRSYAVNSGRFAHETVDDEVIIIDMTEGNYFSLRGCAALIWELAAKGLPLSDIVSGISAATGRAPDELFPDIEAFIGQLEQEDILAEATAPSADLEAAKLAAFEYAPPAIEKYTEMQDLLTLDPIHEVDETGWPNPAEKDTR